VAHVPECIARADPLIGDDFTGSGSSRVAGADVLDAGWSLPTAAALCRRRGVRARCGSRLRSTTCRRFQVHVAFDPRSQAPRAEFGEPIVERTAGRTELRVARIAERKHGKLQSIEPRRAPPCRKSNSGRMSSGGSPSPWV